MKRRSGTEERSRPAQRSEAGVPLGAVGSADWGLAMCPDTEKEAISRLLFRVGVL